MCRDSDRRELNDQADNSTINAHLHPQTNGIYSSFIKESERKKKEN